MLYRGMKLGLSTFLVLSLAGIGTVQAQTLGIATNPDGSVFNRIGVVIAKVINEKLGIQTRVQPFSGTSQIVPIVNNNEVDLGIINELDVEDGFRGVGNFKGRPNPQLRYLVKVYVVPFGYLVPNNSDIKSIGDLKGKRVAVRYTAQRSFHTANIALLANAKLTENDVVGVPVPSSAKAVQMLSQNNLVAAIGGPGAGFIAQANVEMRDRGGVRFIPVNASGDAWVRTKKLMSLRAVTLQPAPHLPGIIGPTTVVGYNVNLVASSKLSDDLAYKITKVLHDSKAPMAEAMPALRGFDPKAMAFQSDVPFHTGAVKLYRESGQWPPKE